MQNAKWMVLPQLQGERVETERKVNKTDRQIVYASDTLDFLRWKILRVRDLLRGFLSFSPLAFRPRERPVDVDVVSTSLYLSL